MKSIGVSRPRLALSILALASLACEPVIAVGWGELTIVVVIMLALLGPPLFRFWSRWDAFKRREAERKKK